MTAITSANAAPVRFSQIVQMVNANPGRANTGGFTQLRLADDNGSLKSQDGDDPPTPQDGRVIITKTTEVVDDDACDCTPIPPPPGGFPKWALLGLAAIPIAIILIHRHKDTPTPTPTTTQRKRRRRHRRQLQQLRQRRHRRRLQR